MQDFTGVPCIVDLATMREAISELGGDPNSVNPLAPAELVIDHSVVADLFGTPDAFERNVDLEYQRNEERYKFLRWGQTAFDEFKVVPPGTGIVHQVNIEHLARVVMARPGQAYPDTLVGTDSHTTMVNGLGVLGWGVGGIEAEAAMLGQPVSMLIPKVVGFQLTGELPAGATATDLVLTITEMLREHGVVGKFVEFYGEGVGAVPLANRATIGNMSPEFGSTAAMFPIDDETLNYLRFTGRDEDEVALVEAYCKEQGLWHDPPPSPTSPRRSRSTCRRSCPRSPGRSVRRTGSRSTPPRSRSGRRSPTTSTTTGRRARSPRSPTASPSRPPTRRREHPNGDADRPSVHRQPVDPVGAVEPDAGDALRRHPARARPRRRDDRGDHVVHEHVEPVGDDRRGAARPQRRRQGPRAPPVGEDLARARFEGRHGLLRALRAAALPGEARVQPRRLRLHHVHRQLRPAARGDLRRPSTTPTSRSPRCSRATATSRAASTPT